MKELAMRENHYRYLELQKNYREQLIQEITKRAWSFLEKKEITHNTELIVNFRLINNEK